jgi:hypothetical protein
MNWKIPKTVDYLGLLCYFKIQSLSYHDMLTNLGSSFVMSLLAQDPQSIYLGELLNPTHVTFRWLPYVKLQSRVLPLSLVTFEKTAYGPCACCGQGRSRDPHLLFERIPGKIYLLWSSYFSEITVFLNYDFLITKSGSGTMPLSGIDSENRTELAKLQVSRLPWIKGDERETHIKQTVVGERIKFAGLPRLQEAIELFAIARFRPPYKLHLSNHDVTSFTTWQEGSPRLCTKSLHPTPPQWVGWKKSRGRKSTDVKFSIV